MKKRLFESIKIILKEEVTYSEAVKIFTKYTNNPNIANLSYDELRKEFRNLALKYHPDKPHGDSLIFRQINDAYEVLSSDIKKRTYSSSSQGASDYFSTLRERLRKEREARRKEEQERERKERERKNREANGKTKSGQELFEEFEYKYHKGFNLHESFLDRIINFFNLKGYERADHEAYNMFRHNVRRARGYFRKRYKEYGGLTDDLMREYIEWYDNYYITNLKKWKEYLKNKYG